MIDLVRSFLPPPPAGELWSGDDAAAISLAGAAALVTTDTMVEGYDFDLSYARGFDLGWKAVAVNVSDVAAMGGTPTHAVATLMLPPSTEIDLVADIAEGLAAAGRRWRTALVGGDLSAAPLLSLGLTAIGEPGPDGIVTRSGARPGDSICVTGSLGGAWGGLAFLRAGRAGEAPDLVARHLRPEARVDEARALAALGATAMIDVSDGFAIDLGRLMAASGTGCDVDPAAVPLDPALPRLVDTGLEREGDLLRGAILGGEDFELLVTLPPDVEPPEGVTVVGAVTEGAALRFGDDDLEELGRNEGWDHLHGR